MPENSKASTNMRIAWQTYNNERAKMIEAKYQMEKAEDAIKAELIAARELDLLSINWRLLYKFMQ